MGWWSEGGGWGYTGGVREEDWWSEGGGRGYAGGVRGEDGDTLVE